jgi:hypothetical protein
MPKPFERPPKLTPQRRTRRTLDASSWVIAALWGAGQILLARITQRSGLDPRRKREGGWTAPVFGSPAGASPQGLRRLTVPSTATSAKSTMRLMRVCLFRANFPLLNLSCRGAGKGFRQQLLVGGRNSQLSWSSFGTLRVGRSPAAPAPVPTAPPNSHGPLPDPVNPNPSRGASNHWATALTAHTRQNMQENALVLAQELPDPTQAIPDADRAGLLLFGSKPSSLALWVLYRRETNQKRGLSPRRMCGAVGCREARISPNRTH